MALGISDDPYYPRSKKTHDAVTVVDPGDPDDGAQFASKLGCNVIVWRASLTSGTARLQLKTWSGRLNAWTNEAGQYFDIAAGVTSGKFDSYGTYCAIAVTAKSDNSALTIEGVHASADVARN